MFLYKLKPAENIIPYGGYRRRNRTWYSSYEKIVAVPIGWLVHLQHVDVKTGKVFADVFSTLKSIKIEDEEGSPKKSKRQNDERPVVLPAVKFDKTVTLKKLYKASIHPIDKVNVNIIVFQDEFFERSEITQV